MHTCMLLQVLSTCRKPAFTIHIMKPVCVQLSGQGGIQQVLEVIGQRKTSLLLKQFTRNLKMEENNAENHAELHTGRC